MNDPIKIIKSFMGKGGNPQLLIDRALKSNTNPMITNLIKMAQNGDSKSVEKFARNIFKEKGRDFDKEFNDFMSNFK